MNLFRFFTLCCGLLLLPSSVLGCSGPPPPFFDPPPYIDPIYIPPQYSDLSISAATWFKLILKNDFQVTQELLENANIFIPPGQALISAKEIAVLNEKISSLLVTKGINAVEKYNFSPSANFLCPSNSPENVLAFLNAVFRDDIVTTGYENFVSIRRDIFASCNPDMKAISQALSELQLKDGTGNYPDYLAGIAYFYNHDYEHALENFEKIAFKNPELQWWNIWGKKNQPSWLYETSAYMIARCHLLMAQKNWDGESKLRVSSSVNQHLESAGKAFTDYTINYPNGFYTDSARSIMRHLYNLAGNQEQLDKLERENLNRALAHLPNTEREKKIANDAIDEFSLRFKGQMDTKHDVPLAITLQILRDADSKITLETLQSRSKEFDAFPDLFRFITALILYRQKDFERLLDLTTISVPINNTPLSLGVESLRARAYEAVGKDEAAIQSWKNIASIAKDQQSQLRIASLYANKGDVSNLFMDADTISDLKILAVFAVSAATEEQLVPLLGKMDLAQDRRHILEQVLLQKFLLQRNYAAMKNLLSRVKDAGIYESIRSPITTLVSNPKDGNSLLQIGVFIYEQYLRAESPILEQYDPWNANYLEEMTPYCIPCRKFTDSKQDDISAFETIAKAQVILQKDNNPLEAKALHFLINCFRGSEFKDRCQGSGNEASNNGQKWFQRLHRTYPQSEWAQKTPYYY